MCYYTKQNSSKDLPSSTHSEFLLVSVLVLLIVRLTRMHSKLQIPAKGFIPKATGARKQF